MKRLALSLMLLGLAGGCASTYSAESWTGGFSEEEIGGNVWTVSYYGNGYTTNETVETYWLYRAAELTVMKGFDGFALSDTRGRTLRNQTIADLVYEGLIGKPGLSAEIAMKKAPVQEEAGVVFDAQALKTFLGPYVTGEKCDGNVCPHVPEYLYPDFAARVKTLPPPVLPEPKRVQR
jgi:hypothetical protein